DCFDRSDRGGAFQSPDHLCRNGRGGHALGHCLWEWDVQVRRRRKDLDAYWPRGFAADCADSGRFARPGKSLCGGGGTCVGTELGGGGFLFEGWREELGGRGVSRRKHG